MSAIKIGLGLIINGMIGAAPLLLLALAILTFSLKKKSDVITIFLEFVVVECIISLTLLGILHDSEVNWNMRNVNFLPFYSTWDCWKGALSGDLSYFIQIVGNILIFVPFGIIYRQVHGAGIKKALVVAFLFPFGIEIFQCIAGRVADADDIICNFVGTMFGYYIHAYASFVWKLPVATEIKTRSIKGRDCLTCFKVVWMGLYLCLIVRLVTLG